jgi:hypothetical protein
VDLVLANKLFQAHTGFGALAGVAMRMNDAILLQDAVFIEHCQFAATSKTGVNGQDPAIAQRSC